MHAELHWLSDTTTHNPYSLLSRVGAPSPCLSPPLPPPPVLRMLAGASNGFYSYAAFIAAAAAFPGFGTSSLDPAANKRELAAFLGQISHETTGGWPTAPDGPYSWGLCWITEGESSQRDDLGHLFFIEAS